MKAIKKFKKKNQGVKKERNPDNSEEEVEALYDADMDDLDSFMYYLDVLHQIKVIGYADNMKMRTLNYQHIFKIPFEKDNGLNLDEIQKGLSHLATSIGTNKALKTKVVSLGRQYMLPGDVLIHGDYHLGSWLKTSSGIKVIDAEFSFKGFAEFDWSVLLAHMYMAEQKSETIARVRNRIMSARNLDLYKTEAYAGIEILRRFFGVAQLPLILDIDKKKLLTELAVEWIMNYKLLNSTKR